MGLGEGHILGMLARNQFQVRACNVSDTSLAVAKSESERRDLNIPLQNKSIYDLDPILDKVDTVLCFEMLEQLMEPEKALKKLHPVTGKDLIPSVPRELVWHLLNMVRRKYWYALRTTLDHSQHWTRQMFINFVSQYTDVVTVKSPLPWTLIHRHPKLRTPT